MSLGLKINGKSVACIDLDIACIDLDILVCLYIYIYMRIIKCESFFICDLFEY